jgi:hypothetical protein
LSCATTVCTASRRGPPGSGTSWSRPNSGIQLHAAFLRWRTEGSRLSPSGHPTGFQLLFRRTKPLPHRVARFRQVNVDNPCTHHDALEFPDGQIVLLTHLREGQRATVLQLPAQPKPMPPSRLCPKSVVFLSGIATRRQVERCHVKTRDTGSGRGRRSAIGARSGLQSTTRFVLLGNNRAPPRGIPLRPDRLPSATPPMSARSDAP